MNIKLCSGNLKEIYHMLDLSLEGKLVEVSKRNQIVRDDWICKASWHDYSLDDLHPLFVSLKQELYYMIRK